MFKKDLLQRRVGLFIASAICYKYADQAIAYLTQQLAANGQAIAVWTGLVLLGLFPFVYEVLLVRKLGYRQSWPLPILAASILAAFVMLWQRHVDSRIALAVYFIPVLVLLFLKKRGDPTAEAGVEPKSAG